MWRTRFHDEARAQANHNLFVLLVLLVPTLTQAAVPAFIPYSGRLSDGTAWGQSTTLDLVVTKADLPALDAKYLDVSGDTATGTLSLPSNGLAVGTSQLVAANGKVGVGTTSPSETLSVAGTTSLNNAIFEKAGMVHVNTNWVTIFTSGNVNSSAVAFVEIVTEYGTPGIYASKKVVMVRGNRSAPSVVQQVGDSSPGYSNISFQWSGSNFQVKSDNKDVDYTIRATLHSNLGNTWNHTWGTGW